MGYKKRTILALPLLFAIRAVAQDLPTPWVSIGCYTDTPLNHTLNAANTNNAANMTIEACIDFCMPNGYTFAAVGSGQNCYCDYNIQAPNAPSTDGCTLQCTGDSTEICGGTDVTNVFKRIIPAGWNSIGCYTDDPSERTLKTAATTDPGGMTIEECTSFCTPLGFQFAGVEFGRECYCDNIIEPTSAPATDGCTMPCDGDPNQLCGGPNRINVYNRTIPLPPVLIPPVPTIPQTVGTYKYQGCFFDLVNGASNSLGHRKIIPGGTTLETCTTYCQAANFAVAGVELGHECWCDSFMGLAERAPDSDCNLPCQGPDNSQACGAVSRLAVYTDTSATPPPLHTCLSNIISLVCTVESFRFDLQAVPVHGGTPLTLGIMSQPGGDPDKPIIYPLISSADFQPGNRSFNALTFNLLNNTFFPDAVGADGISVARNITPGIKQTFMATGMSGQSFQANPQYCIMPNPLQTFGPFIGPPTIAVNGRNDQWVICTDNVTVPTIFFNLFPSPNNPVNCTGVWLSMVYPSVSSNCNGC